MTNDVTFKLGDIIVSKLHPKIGEFVSRDGPGPRERAWMRYMDGTVVPLPVKMIRHATEGEIGEFRRRKELKNS